MLNRDICLKCWLRKGKPAMNGELYKSFDRYWRSGSCMCRYYPLLVPLKEVPEKCPYVVEQTVSKENASMVQ